MVLGPSRKMCVQSPLGMQPLVRVNDPFGPAMWSVTAKKYEFTHIGVVTVGSRL